MDRPKETLGYASPDKTQSDNGLILALYLGPVAVVFALLAACIVFGR